LIGCGLDPIKNYWLEFSENPPPLMTITSLPVSQPLPPPGWWQNY
jgi:hypothetical protein